MREARLRPLISGWNFHHNLDDESMQLLVCRNPASRRKYRTKSHGREREEEEGQKKASLENRPTPLGCRRALS